MAGTSSSSSGAGSSSGRRAGAEGGGSGGAAGGGHMDQPEMDVSELLPEQTGFIPFVGSGNR